jgi:hypothetical protein
MFPTRYFPASYFAPRYFPEAGADIDGGYYPRSYFAGGYFAPTYFPKAPAASPLSFDDSHFVAFGSLVDPTQAVKGHVAFGQEAA